MVSPPTLPSAVDALLCCCCCDDCCCCCCDVMGTDFAVAVATECEAAVGVFFGFLAE